ncbi:cytochrome C [Cupriavidus sp. IDO]|nr:cytochrome C [Cupriavidus sp. IDO]
MAFAVPVLLALLAASADARADAAAGQAKAQVCVACHGPQGNSTNPAYPQLAGQTARYLYLQLRDFKEGRRSHPAISPAAAPLSKEDMLDLSDYFSAQKPMASTYKVDSARVAAGRSKAEEVLCTMCHLGGFSGQNEIPRVAGQHYAYIVNQLEDFRARRRTNDAGNMTSVSRNLSDDDIRNLASYITNLN